jgi:kinesin family member 5
MNEASSRSHSLFTLTVAMANQDDGTRKIGRLHLVDLAGSEQVNKTGASGNTLEEAKSINKSLSTLGMVILALVKKQPYVPYRDSKLTRVLQNSLGGNSKTCVIITLSPARNNLAETLSSIRFG